MHYPDSIDPSLVGTYPALAKAGGGYVWDAVLEYRVWCHPERGAADHHDGNDYYYSFATYQEALEFSENNEGTEEPLALILQEEHIDEPEVGKYVHVKERRITEWPPEFLSRPKRTPNTITDFLSPDAPANRLDIIRGLALPKRRPPGKLVTNLNPRLNPGAYAFCTLCHGEPIPEEAISHFAEAEGVSIIVPIEVAERLGLLIGFKAEWITLEVHSDLSAVGLTALVSTALVKAGISCNVVAGFHHDHLFVPAGKGKEAVRVLLELQGSHQAVQSK